jgi:hypothetical protein
MAANSIRSELAAAFRAVGAEYRRLPEAKRPDVSWNATDDLLEAALGTCNRAKALAAIREWERHWMGLFEEASR